MAPLPSPLLPPQARQPPVQKANSVRGDSLGSKALSHIANAFLGTLQLNKSAGKNGLRSSKSAGKVYADNRTSSKRSMKRTTGRHTDADDDQLRAKKVSIRERYGGELQRAGTANGLDFTAGKPPPMLGSIPNDSLQGSLRNIASKFLGTGSEQGSQSTIGSLKRPMRRNDSDYGMDGDEFDDMEDEYDEEDEENDPASRRRAIAGEEQDEVAYFSQRSGSFNVKVTHRFVLHPHGRARSVWDACLLVIITWILFTTPFELAFRELSSPTRNFILRFDNVLDFLFAVDILLNFTTAVESDGKLHFSYRSISRHYLAGWFLFDVLLTLPFYVMVNGASGATLPEFISIGDLFRSNPYPLLRIIRLCRILSISRVRRRLEYSLRISSSSSSLGSFAYTVMGLSHLLSCMFAFLAFGDSEQLNEALADGTLQDDSIYTKYVASSYWSIMTIATVGYGDLTVRSNAGRLFSILAMVTGGGIFAYGISNVVDLFQQLYVEETEHRHKMDQVNTLMHDRNLPRKLRDEIRANFFHLRKATKENKAQDLAIVLQMSRTMQSRVADLFCNDMMPQRMPTLAGCNAEFIHSLYLAMEVQCYLPGEDIIRQDEYGTEMYFLFVGHVQVFVGHTRVAMFGPNSCFGEFAIMNPKKPRLATIQALDFCETHCIQRQELLKHVVLHPFMLHSIRQLVNLRRRKALAMLTDQTIKSRTLIQSLAAVWYNEGLAALIPNGMKMEDFPHLMEYVAPPTQTTRFGSVRGGLTQRRRSVTPAMGFEGALGEPTTHNHVGSTLSSQDVLKLRRKISAQDLDKSDAHEGQASAHGESSSISTQPRVRRVGTRPTDDGDDRLGMALHQMNVMLKRQEQLEKQIQSLLAARHRGSVASSVPPSALDASRMRSFEAPH